MVSLSRRLFLVLLVVLMMPFSCAKPTPFEVHASYRSAANPTRQYAVHTTGAYPPGADMADAYRGRIIATIGDTHYQLTVNAERFTPKLDQIELPKDLAATVGQAVDRAFLMRFILAIDSTASKEQAQEEANELFKVLEAAGMGPKVGLPTTQKIVRISVSYDYL
jgi:hypothetical protein